MSIFPSSPNIGDQYSGYEWDGTAWKVIGIDLNVDYATAQELTDALADTTGVHGIADTSTLETQSGAQSKADAAETAANSYTDTAIASFEALPDQTGHSGEYLTTDGSVTSWGAVDVSGEIATHNADTTDVHGIADTSALVVTTDSRLSDARTPTAHASSHASGGSDAVTLAISQVTGLQTALDGKVDDSQVLTNVPLGAVFTDTTTNETITLSGDVSGSGTSSIVVTVADDSHNHIIGNVDGLQTALDTKAPLASPTLTGTPTAPTAVSGTNTTQIATTAFVASAVSGIIDSAPTTLDTLNELAAALGDDPNFATTVTNLVATKQPLDADLTAIAGLTGTSGLLKKTAADTWTLDTNTYITGNQTITLSGDVSGSGTTSISVTVADDSHNHIISNIDGLQTALDGKQALDADLTAIAALSGTSGFLKKTAANTWALDTNSYLTGNQTITLSGDVSGSGTTSISVTVADNSHNHTSLTGVTSISFAAEASDSASITRTINGTGTYIDFNLADDNNNDWWRWRFTPTGSTVYDAMTLKPSTNGVSDLVVAGAITGTRLVSNVATGTSPLSVSSTTVVTNLNADLLDGYQASSFALLSGANFTGGIQSESGTQDNITSRTKAGFWQTGSATTAEGWPETTNTWYHMIAATHSNTSNYFSLQLAAPFYSNKLYFRSTNGSGATTWSEVATTEYVNANAGGGFEQGFFLGGM